MKKLALLTAFLLGSAMTQAVACELNNVHASAQNSTVVACAGGTVRLYRRPPNKSQPIVAVGAIA